MLEELFACESGDIHLKSLLLCFGIFLRLVDIESWETALRLKTTIVIIPILIRETSQGDKGKEDLLENRCVSIAPSTDKILALMDKSKPDMAISNPTRRIINFIFLNFIEGLTMILQHSPVVVANKRAGLNPTDFIQLDIHFLKSFYATMMPSNP